MSDIRLIHWYKFFLYDYIYIYIIIFKLVRISNNKKYNFFYIVLYIHIIYNIIIYNIIIYYNITTITPFSLKNGTLEWQKNKY